MLALQGDHTAGQHITFLLKVRWRRRSSRGRTRCGDTWRGMDIGLRTFTGLFLQREQYTPGSLVNTSQIQVGTPAHIQSIGEQLDAWIAALTSVGTFDGLF